MIYLDSAASTHVAPEVMQAMQPYFTDIYANPGSVHTAGLDAAKAVQDARISVADSIGANPDDIIFTSGGSESNALAILGVSGHLRAVRQTHIITTQIEHPSVLECFWYLERNGFSVTYLKPDAAGSVSVDTVKSALRNNTGLVSVMYINNETGTLQSALSTGRLCREREILFHTDFVQGYGKFPMDVQKENIDFLSISGHKVHAPKSVGALYVKRKQLLDPLIYGGGQEYGLRSGTENVAGVVGFGAAAQMIQEYFRHKHPYHLDWFVDKIKANLSGVYINGCTDWRSNIVNLRFDGVDGETLLLLLSGKGVMVSAGSACHAHSSAPSHVLTAIGLTGAQARQSIRISISRYTTKQELETAADIITEAVKTLRSV